MKRTCSICQHFSVRPAAEIAPQLKDLAQRLREGTVADGSIFRAAGYVDGALSQLAHELLGVCPSCGEAQETAGRKLTRADWIDHGDHPYKSSPSCPYCEAARREAARSKAVVAAEVPHA